MSEKYTRWRNRHGDGWQALSNPYRLYKQRLLLLLCTQLLASRVCPSPSTMPGGTTQMEKEDEIPPPHLLNTSVAAQQTFPSPFPTHLHPPNHASEWNQRTFLNLGFFAEFSAYRMSASQVAVVGLGRWAERRKWGRGRMGRCLWRGLEGDGIWGTVKVLLGGEGHDLTYHTIVILCQLESDAGRGGGLTVEMEHEWYLLYKEGGGHSFRPNPTSPYRHNITMCSAPVYGQLRAAAVVEWVEYTHAMGVDFYAVYDAEGEESKIKDVLKSYVAVGMVTIDDVSDVLAYDTWMRAQNLFVNDCMYRFVYDSKWVAVGDFDEYFYIKVRLADIHRVKMATGRGVDLSTDVALHCHLGGLATEKLAVCDLVVGGNRSGDGDVMDTFLAERVARVRANPSNFEEYRQRRELWENFVRKEQEMQMGVFAR